MYVGGWMTQCHTVPLHKWVSLCIGPGTPVLVPTAREMKGEANGISLS